MSAVNKKLDFFPQGLRQASTTQKVQLGFVQELADGRSFVYVKAGTGGLTAGKAVVAPAATANHINCAVSAAAAIGSTTVSLTLGATAATANQYADGMLQVNDATGEGYQYRIAHHAAADSGGVLTVTLEEPIIVALVASTSEVSLIANPCKGVVHSDAEENVCLGIAMATIAADSFGWVQYRGLGVALVAGTPAVGTMLTLGSVAGSLTGISTTIATTVTQPIVAVALATAGVNTEYKPVMLRCW